MLAAQTALRTASTATPVLTAATINQRIVRAEYAVRGEIVLKAQAMAAAGRDVVFCNIGNPQALGQAPLSFPRHVLALTACPQLLDMPVADAPWGDEAVARVCTRAFSAPSSDLRAPCDGRTIAASYG